MISVFALVGKFQVGFHDIALLYSRTRYYTTFLGNNSRGERLGTTTCLGTVVGCKQGHAPCKVPLLRHMLFLCQSNFMVAGVSEVSGVSGHSHI